MRYKKCGKTLQKAMIKYGKRDKIIVKSVEKRYNRYINVEKRDKYRRECRLVCCIVRLIKSF